MEMGDGDGGVMGWGWGFRCTRRDTLSIKVDEHSELTDTSL